MIKYIITVILFFYFSSCYAATITYGSYPQSEGVYFSDGNGNSIYMGTTQSIPYIYTNYPTAVWVDAYMDRLPTNLLIYQYINGYPNYLCRVLFNRQWIYGQLIINKGCKLQNNNNFFSSFQVLVR